MVEKRLRTTAVQHYRMPTGNSDSMNITTLALNSSVKPNNNRIESYLGCEHALLKWMLFCKVWNCDN